MRIRNICAAVLLMVAATAVAQNCPTFETKKEYLKLIANRRTIDPSYVGTVTLIVDLSDKAKINSARVEKSTSRALEKPALKQLREIKFDPATKDGKPVRVLIEVEINLTRNENCEFTRRPAFDADAADVRP